MKLTPQQREERRHRAVAALARGLSQKQVAELMATSVASVSQWKTRFNHSGAAGLAAKPQGRPPRLAAGSAMDAVRARLLDRRPEDEGLGHGLWDAAGVAALMARAGGERVSRWTVQRYLGDWGLAPPGLAERCEAPRSGALPLIVQGGRGPETHWLLWARRPRGDWSFLAYPHPPRAAEAEAFVERLLIRWPARLALLAPQSDPFWTRPVLEGCAARWPGRVSIRGDHRSEACLVHQK